MRAFVLFIAALTASFAFGQGLFGTESQAFVLMPALSIASAHTKEIQLSPSGRLVLYQQIPVGTPESLFMNPTQAPGKWLVYDRVSKTNKVVKLPDDTHEIYMLADDATLFFTSGSSELVRGFYNVNTGSTVPINTQDADIIYMGSSKFANCLFGISKGQLLVGFFPNGTVTTARIDPNFRIQWPIGGDANTVTFTARAADKSRTKQFKAILSRSSFTLTFGEMSLEEYDSFRSSLMPEHPEFTARANGDMDYISILDETAMPSASPEGSNSTNKVIKKAQSQTLIPKSTRLGPAGGQVVFSDRGDFVVYQDAGALLLREIKPIDPAAAEKLAMADLKQKLLMKAKVVGMGFMMYGADNDDILPGAEGWEIKLQPYMKDREMLNDFNYSFRGGNISEIANPSTTEMGFVVGPGGRAVVYLDGSAKWIPNP